MTNATNNTSIATSTTTTGATMNYMLDTTHFSGTKSVAMYTQQLLQLNPMSFDTEEQSAHHYALLSTTIFMIADSLRGVLTVDAAFFPSYIRGAVEKVAVANIELALDQVQWLCALTNESIMDVLVELDIVALVEENNTVTLTRRCVESILVRKGMKPRSTPAGLKPAERTARDEAHLTTGHKKAFSLVKGALGELSVTGKTAVTLLQGTEFKVNLRVLEAYNAVATAYSHLAWIKENTYALVGALELGTASFFQQYDADKRIRLYAQCHLGPNPMGGDVQQGLCSFADSRVTKMFQEGTRKLTAGCQAFVDEMKDVSGGGVWMKKETIMSIAANPQAFIAQYAQDIEARKELTEEEAAKAPKLNQPDSCIKYLAMVFTFADFVNHGEAAIITPIGLDAKCSGTQIYSILANNPALGDMCGLTYTARTEQERKDADPYTTAAQHMNVWMRDNGFDPMGRNDLKTPYMAIQYGGSVKAVIGGGTAAKFRAGVLKRDGDLMEMGGQAVIAIRKTLGLEVTGLINSIGYNVETKCLLEGKDYLNIKMSDGTVIKNPIRNSREVCPAFSVILQPARFDEVTGEMLQDDFVVNFGGEFSNTQVDADGEPLEVWTVKADLDCKEFARTFAVNYIQSLDALLARTVARFMMEAGVTSYVSVHDCFRCHAEDYHLLLGCIRQAYDFLFVQQDQFAMLESQVGALKGYVDREGEWVAYARPAGNFVTTEMLNNDNSYFFCK